MDSCSICGGEAFQEAIVEGARVPLCPRDLHYGRPIPQAPRPVATRSSPASSVYRPTSSAPTPKGHELVDDFAAQIARAREKAGLTRQQLARALFIMENVIERIEHGSLHPDLKTAQKLEKFLGLRLVVAEGQLDAAEKEKDKQAGQKSNPASKISSQAGLTMGDVIDVRMKKG